MDDIRIPNEATYAPIALTDLLVAAPLASRILLGATLPGRAIQLAALGLYAGSVARDWSARREMKRIDFLIEYGADIRSVDPQPHDFRRREIEELGGELNDGYVATRPPRQELAREVNAVLTDYLASVTGQRVETSSEIRSLSLAGLVFPFALGTCDVLSGDIAIFRDTGIFEAHVICHEFVHRKGYLKEMHAQALAYLALRNSGVDYLVQSARAERLQRQIRVLSGDDPAAFREMVAHARLREELEEDFMALRPDPGVYQSLVGSGMKQVYELRMKATGQNGLSDYDEGFTNFLFTFARSTTALQPREHAAV